MFIVCQNAFCHFVNKVLLLLLLLQTTGELTWVTGYIITTWFVHPSQCWPPARRRVTSSTSCFVTCFTASVYWTDCTAETSTTGYWNSWQIIWLKLLVDQFTRRLRNGALLSSIFISHDNSSHVHCAMHRPTRAFQSTQCQSYRFWRDFQRCRTPSRSHAWFSVQKNNNQSPK